MSGLTTTATHAPRPRTLIALPALLLAAQVGCRPAGIAPGVPAPTGDYADLWAAVPERAAAAPAKARRLLVFSRSEGFAHEAIRETEIALQYLGEKTGAFEVTVATDMNAFDASNLARFDAVLFNNTTQLAFEDPARRRALLEFVRGGNGVIGIHAATDNFYDFPEAAAMMGGLFDGHPWGAGGTWAVKIDEPGHPLNRSFAGKAFLIRDEIYQITGPYSRDTHRVLLSLDMSNLRNRQVEGIKRDDDDFPISWIRPFGEGRVFYCSLGHSLEVLRNEAVLAHYLAGIQYALGDLDVDDTPSSALVPAPRPALTTDSGAVDDPFILVVHQAVGSSRLPEAAIEDVIRHASPQQYRAIEDRFIEILQNPGSTYAAKQFVCRMLRQIGPDRSLPYLAQMLLDDALTDDARFAMQGHASPAIDRTLRESLDRLSGAALVGVVGTIGQRRDRDAVPQLVGLIDTTDPGLTAAIVGSLRQIGGPQARDALLGLELPAGLEPLRQDALLRGADDLEAEGAHAEARTMYRRMTAESFPIPVRVAAWRGLIRSQRSEAVPSLLTLLRSDEPEMQRAGARFMIEMRDAVDLMPVAEALATLSESARALAISALASAGVEGATPIVAGLAERGSGPVRAAALRAVGALGNASHVPLLAAIAVGQDDSLPARESLVLLWGEGVNARIVAAVNRYEGDARAALIDVLAARYAVSAVPTFLTYADDDNAAVRQASIAALSALAEDHRLPDLIALLERSENEDDRLALEDAILAVCGRMADRESSMALLLEAAAGGSESDRVSLVRVLGNWTDAAPLDTLLALAGGATTDGELAAAIAGALKLMSLPHKRPSAEDEQLFRRLFSLARNSEQRELVLEGLAGRADVWIFGMIEPLLSDPELGERAASIRADLLEAVARTVSHDGVGSAVTLAHPYAGQYSGGGANALTDDRWGTANPGDGAWQGFEGEDLDGVVDLGRTIEIRGIRAGFLQANGSWVFLPREVTFAIAGEDRVFETVASFTLPVPEAPQRNATRSVSTELSGKTARYVRVVATNIGTLPAWHSSAGEKAWLFADEIQVNAHLDPR